MQPERADLFRLWTYLERNTLMFSPGAFPKGNDSFAHPSHLAYPHATLTH